MKGLNLIIGLIIGILLLSCTQKEHEIVKIELNSLEAVSSDKETQLEIEPEEEISKVKISDESSWPDAEQETDYGNKATPTWEGILDDRYLNILRQEVIDFSSYETNPLDKFLGKWILMDQIGNYHSSESSIEFFLEGSQYRYKEKYYSSLKKGRLFFTNTYGPILWPDNITNSTTLKDIREPVETTNCELAIFITEESSAGYYVFEDKNSNYRSTWGIENLSGTWISNSSLVSGTLFWGEGYLSWDLTDINVKIDLEQKILQMPGNRLFLIEETYKDEENFIYLKVYSEETDRENSFYITIKPLDISKAYITHEQWEEWNDKRFSPEEKYAWYLLPPWASGEN